MEDYYQKVVNHLTTWDFDLLAFLATNAAVKPMDAKNKQEIIDATHFTSAMFRKIITRLETLLFIESVREGKSYAFYLTEYGIKAFNELSNEILKNQ